ncbi:hypothetical protein [Pareuzebyella sediminis]|uniref:hypothetical protein n=1 Tax=Pareuzebyella sediminis TaxID=2607998 RepID=UPI0011ED9E82|nr:hypothetical protein [Pareuzebyella sediminis]
MRNVLKPSSNIYIITALIFLITSIVAFAPTSINLISKIETGQRPMPPLILHFHAASMCLWLSLLCVQTILIKSKNYAIHKKLGIASMVLATGILISMFGIDIANIEGRLGISNSNTQNFLIDSSGLLLIHGVSYLFFPLFYVWAIVSRRKDSETHKRMMILATAVLMIPGLGRLIMFSKVLPDFGLIPIDARHLYMLVLITPAITYDVYIRRLPHRSYLIGLGLLAVWIVSAHFIWGTTWWIGFVTKLLG